MNKVYGRINWQNYPSTETAINESNLNKMDSALNEIDTRVVEHETTKANVSSLNELINYWHIDKTTGVITIHKVSGEQIIFDLNLEKVPVGFSMTDDGILIMTTDDGTEFTANISSMIPILTFEDSDQIAVSVSGEGVNKTYSFSIKTGSIAEDKLQPNFLADCRLYAGNAENSAILAGEYAEQSKESAESLSDVVKQVDENAEAISAINAAIIPQFISKPGETVSIPTGTATNTNSIELTKGTWYVSANVRWESAGTSGIRSMVLTSSSNPSDQSAGNTNALQSIIDTIPAINKAYVTQLAQGLLRVTSDRSMYLHVYQNSGSAVNAAYNSISAYKLSENVV